MCVNWAVFKIPLSFHWILMNWVVKSPMIMNKPSCIWYRAMVNGCLAEERSRSDVLTARAAVSARRGYQTEIHIKLDTRNLFQQERTHGATLEMCEWTIFFTCGSGGHDRWSTVDGCWEWYSTSRWTTRQMRSSKFRAHWTVSGCAIKDAVQAFSSKDWVPYPNIVQIPLKIPIVDA